MKTLLDLPGIITVLNTPFTEDDTIDLDGLQRNTRLALDAGVAGFLVPAMASEVLKLSEDEREQMVRMVVETAAGRVPVIGGSSAPGARTRLRVGERLLALGCQGMLVSIPFHDARQYEHDLREVAGLHPPFLMVQDWDASGGGLPIPLIVRLFEEIEEFRCLKIEVVPAGSKYSAVLSATGGRLHISGGWAVMQMIEALDRGVHAFMPTGMHSIYTRIFSLYRQGRRECARELFQRLLPVLAFSNQHLDISIHFFKRLLHRQGVYHTARVREPILAFDEYHEQTAEELIAYAMRLMEECDAGF